MAKIKGQLTPKFNIFPIHSTLHVHFLLCGPIKKLMTALKLITKMNNDVGKFPDPRVTTGLAVLLKTQSTAVDPSA